MQVIEDPNIVTLYSQTDKMEHSWVYIIYFTSKNNYSVKNGSRSRMEQNSLF